MGSPLLILPHPHQEIDQETKNLSQLFSLKNKKFYSLQTLHLQDDFQCVGSSMGWLAFVDENGNPFLLNPFSRTRIDLPHKQTLPHYIHHVSKSLLSGSYFAKIDKIVLCSTPSRDHLHYSNCAVIAMYSSWADTKIAFCRLGDQIWSHLDHSDSKTYYDVVCCDRTNTVYALGPGPTVESWDFNELVPKKKMMIQEYSCPRKLTQAHRVYPNDLYSSQWYLVSSYGHIFLVVRYIGEFVRQDGKVVYEGDTLTDYAAEPLVCPYKTVDFHVFKVDFDRMEWIEVECLDGFSMFLGGNQSMMVWAKEHDQEYLNGNCIYFTDDYWDRMDEDYSYGGHDMGIFNMEDGTIDPILDCQQDKIKPPPFWISLPNQNEI